VSIAVLIGVHDGIVLAADSASTLTTPTPAPPGMVPGGVLNVYDNANKIFNLYKGKPIGCITYGSGSIGNSSISTLIKDLRAILMDEEKRKTLPIIFDPGNYTMEGVSQIVASFLADACQKQDKALLSSMNIGLLLGGYSTGGSLGESWSVEIKEGKAVAPRQLRPPDQPGINWGGASEVLQRIILGYSSGLFQVLAEVSGAQDQPPATPQQLYEQLNLLLATKLQAALVFAPMPIQDAIDLGRFLVYAAIMYSRFLSGAQIVGGPIEIAAITKHEHFKWISRKHYFDQSLNQEVKHVIVESKKD